MIFSDIFLHYFGIESIEELAPDPNRLVKKRLETDES
jgi:hypothetical protein